MTKNLQALIMSVSLLLLAFTCNLTFTNSQAKAAAEPNYVEASFVDSPQSIEPGTPFKLAIQLKMQPGWHTYYKDPGDAGLATSIKWKLPPGFEAGPIQWPKPEKFIEEGITTYGYKDRAILGTLIKPPAKLDSKQKFKITAHVEWLQCKESCIPGEKDLTLDLSVAQKKKSLKP